MATLKFVNEAGQEEFLHVGPDRPEILIGRNKECELRTRNNTVSRLHAKVVWRDGQYLILDLDSANGTFYQRRRVKEAVLEDGESLFVGSLPVDFHLEPADRAPATEVEPPPVPAPDASTHLVQPADPARPTAAYDSGLLVPPDGLGTQHQGSSVSLAPVPAPAAAPSADDEIVSFAEDRPAPAPVVRDTAEAALDHATDRAAEAKRLLQEERVRESRDDLSVARIQEIEAQLAERDDRIRKLGLQVEELTKLSDRLQAQAGTEGEAALRMADLERVLNANEAERLGLEDQIEAERARVEETGRLRDEAASRADALQAELESVRAEARGAEARIAELQTELAGAKLQAGDLATEVEGLRARLAETEAAAASPDEVTRLAAERDALIEETHRWETLKKHYEADRSQAQAELEAVRKQVSELTVQVADARGASGRAESMAAELKAATDELAEVKIANRSYLKKISRLLEESEGLRAAGAAAPAVADAAPLKAELETARTDIERLQAEAARLRGERDEAASRAERMAERVAALEAAPPAAAPAEPPAPAPAPDDGAGASLAAARESLERINEAVSRSRTGLEVIAGLLPEMLERIPEGGDELGEQVRSAVGDLQDAVREMKAEVLKARRA